MTAPTADDVRSWLLRGDVRVVRIAWCDWHGLMRGKTLMPAAALQALADGVSMVSTIVLKDTSDRTAVPVFEPGAFEGLSGFGMANNLVLHPDPASFRRLPWAPGTAWMRAEPRWGDGTPLAVDPRGALEAAVQRLAQRGLALRCGLEVEFHVYRIDGDDRADPADAHWPGEPPRVSLLHPGWQLLGEAWADRADEALAIVRETALGLGLPLRSLEVELGPSQFEAVFDPVAPLEAADHMALLRSAVKQALRRAGYHATFMCRPPFPQVMSSGWHLHHSVVDVASGRNLQAELGEHWLGGLVAHGRGMASFCTSTVNGYGRFRPNAMAPVSVQWGHDNRGTMLRVLGQGDHARIENRLGEPLANPYLYIAAQIHAGLDGLERRLSPGAAATSPYAAAAASPLPASLGEALDALHADERLAAAFGAELVDCWTRIKRSEQARHDAAPDRELWQRREYFSRY